MLKYKAKQVDDSDDWAVFKNKNDYFVSTVGTEQEAKKNALIMSARYCQSMMDSIELDLRLDHGVSYDEFLDYMA